MFRKLGRWCAPLGAGFCFASILAGFLYLHLKLAEAGLAFLVGGGFFVSVVQHFAEKFVATLFLPFYLVSGLVLWVLALCWAALFHRGYSHTWRAREGFALTLSALAWTHLVLWWQVPCTLWLLPGISRLPFWLVFPLLLTGSLAYPVVWIRKQGLNRIKAPAVLCGWLAFWTVIPILPQVMPRLLTPAKGGPDSAKVVLIGLDGLREDVGQQNTQSWPGSNYTHAYTVIPATRMVWHILWGGDPLYYTVGHAPPAIEEITGSVPLPLVDEAARRGWRPRFYIDDGGTIGLAGRTLNFDDLLMPAAGWENFVNSNLTASFPLFATWENWARAFPTTNPWAPLDGGLREALRLGRGSKWVMFHSCLAHQPIFLRRQELAKIHRWWTLPPAALEPYVIRQQVTPARAANYDLRRDPFQAYTIRMQSILAAWEPIWNEMAQDPQYKGAVRVLFSDHGERFYHVTEQIQLGGVHGYDLDPWETRIMMKIAGPGFDAARGTLPRPATISILSLRDGIANMVLDDRPMTQTVLEQAYPKAPMRYYGLDRNFFMQEPAEYRLMNVNDLVKHTGIAPNGVWFTQYNSSPSERAKDVMVAWGQGEDLTVFRPLKSGGAHRYDYKNFELKGITTVTEATYVAEKEKVNACLGHPLFPNGFPQP